ncbi:hypothetical protein Q5H93_22400 [Hymenobacter sp. ASUV-10]|uniref:T9SS type A sorting domain-containing protein n=1 Tax=Hymenobacter aranciens TaxID=3063996 RepID=A0ABT9BGY0_9BACT|nr:hypothetical protein [Hymenobacter sp. ASUV-10]MDO7877507.1 hypothetical protein [Hymenobacter sp. ASUV-10]
MLQLQGATLTSTCDAMWGGVELVDNGRIVTLYDNGPSRISEAAVGVLVGTSCRSTEASYDLSDTDFYNNTYGVAVWGNDPAMAANCRIEYCQFYSDHTQRLVPENTSMENPGSPDGNYGNAGLVLRGDGHAGIPYRSNAFHELYAGAELAGEGIVFDYNVLDHCYGTAIRVGAPDEGQLIGYLRVEENEVTVPDNPFPEGQVPPDAEVMGIELMGMGLEQPTGSELYVTGNDVTGLSRGNSPQKRLVGLGGYLCFERTSIEHHNVFTTLDTGVRLQDATAQLDVSRAVANNLFNDCEEAVALRDDIYAPTVACNQIEGSDYGIVLENGADVGYLGTNDEPCGNNYSVNAASVINGSGVSIDYYAHPQELVTGPLLNVLYSSSGYLDCNSRGHQYGLRAAPPVPITTVEHWQQQLLTQTGSPQQLRQYERRIIAYYAAQEQWATLDAFTATLPLSNDAAYERLGLYLLETYRRLQQPADVQRLRTDLLSWRGANPDLRQRIAYFDVSEQLRHLRPGQRPTAADSATLATVAASATSYAAVACTTLRYYYPGVTCQGTPPPPPAARLLAAAHPTTHTEKLRLSVAPNPAHETVQVSWSQPCPTAARLELVAVGNGQIAHAQPVAPAQLSLELNVAALPPGVYAARLVGPNGQPLATTKLVVVH